MSDATYVAEAQSIARELTQRESRGPGDMENAWSRLEARYGVPYGVFWALRYKKPKGIYWDVFNRLLAARDAERERQMRLLRHDIETTKQIAGPSHAAVVAAEALVGEENSEEVK